MSAADADGDANVNVNADIESNIHSDSDSRKEDTDATRSFVELLKQCKANNVQKQHIRSQLHLESIDCQSLGHVKLPQSLLEITDAASLLVRLMRIATNPDYIPVPVKMRNIAQELVTQSPINKLLLELQSVDDNARALIPYTLAAGNSSSQSPPEAQVQQLQSQWDRNLAYFAGNKALLNFAAYVHMVIMIYRFTLIPSGESQPILPMDDAIKRTIDWGMLQQDCSARYQFTCKTKKLLSFISYLFENPWELILYFSRQIPLNMADSLPVHTTPSYMMKHKPGLVLALYKHCSVQYDLIACFEHVLNYVIF
jgi:hypothetical protein